MDFLTFVGYLASSIIATSMVMSSIVRLRWINLLGASMFSLYGYIIGAIPVGVLNSFIVMVDIIHLIKIYRRQEYFRILNVRSNNKYLLAFLEFYGQDIEAFFPGFVYKPELNTQSFFILRDMAVAGVVLARDRGENELFVSLDFVIPQYRDFKLGKYLYESGSGFFPKSGYRHVVLEPKSKKFEDYLKKMGFIQSAHENSASYHKRYNDL